MKRILIATTILLSLSGSIAHSQVGVNIETPQATLDVVATKTDNSTAEGIIAPRLTRAQLVSKDLKYVAAQDGAIVYVTDATGATSTKTTNITKAGYYYFDKVTLQWQPIGAVDNLGNHTAGQSLNLNGHSLSNDGTETEGIKIDAAGNVTAQQGLTIKAIPGGAAADYVLTADVNGVVKRAPNLDISNIPKRTTYPSDAGVSIPKNGGTYSFTLGTGGGDIYPSLLTVLVGNGCGQFGKAIFLVTSWDNGITPLGYTAGNSVYTVTADAVYGRTVTFTSNSYPCADGGQTDQFDFKIERGINANCHKITITNLSASVDRTYFIRRMQL